MTDSRVYPPFVRGRRLRGGLALAGAALALFVLSGCTGDAGSTPAPTTSAGAGSNAEPSESATPSPTPTPEAAGTAVALSCDEILSAQDVYDFNPNYGTAPDYTPAAGTAAATALDYDGVACAWSNQTSGELIEISIIQPNEVLTTTLMNEAISGSNAVPTYGNAPDVQGFFTSASGTGEARIFTGGYWIAASSQGFFEPGDAQTLLATVVSHLP